MPLQSCWLYCTVYISVSHMAEPNAPVQARLVPWCCQAEMMSIRIPQTGMKSLLYTPFYKPEETAEVAHHHRAPSPFGQCHPGRSH